MSRMTEIEKLFLRYAPIIPDFRSFIEAINRPLDQSFRINTLKAKREQLLNLLKDLKIKSVPFYTCGFFLENRTVLGNHFSHTLGLIYAQEIASMVPVIVLDPQLNETVLDLCAAPGSKTTQIAQAMENTGLVVVNEVNRKRTAGLINNIKRCGLMNEVVISLRGEKIGRILPDYFDRILIDAPCSVEGTIRKSKAVLYHWGLKNIQRMAWLQKGLIVSGFRALRPGGIMVYSTCTIAPEENEGVMDYLLKKFPEAELMPITIPNLKYRPGITKWQNESYDHRVTSCTRILPQDNDTAPFFIAKITKRGIHRRRADYFGKIEFKTEPIQLLSKRFGIPPQRFKNYAIFQEQDTFFIATAQAYSFLELKTIRKGLEIGKIYDHELKPDNDFVQLFARDIKRNFVEVKEWELKRFLRGENISAAGIDNGFVIITYKNFPVGVGRSKDREIKSEVQRARRIHD